MIDMRPGIYLQLFIYQKNSVRTWIGSMMVALYKVKIFRFTDTKPEQSDTHSSTSPLQMANKFCHLLNIRPNKDMSYEGFSLILSRNICHHMDMNNEHRISHNYTVVRVRLVDTSNVDISIFPTEFT